jgi:dolichyl-phosphate-mannose--protein O-mannosyl transferase
MKKCNEGASKEKKRSHALTCSTATLILLTFVSGYVRARRIDSPRTPIFDESYAGFIVNRYRHSDAHFFDLHPPFGRLLQFNLAVNVLGAPECMYTKVRR